MTTRALLTELRNANTQTDIGREILDKLLEETKKPSGRGVLVAGGIGSRILVPGMPAAG
jgi:hypothetical protein